MIYIKLLMHIYVHVIEGDQFDVSFNVKYHWQFNYVCMNKNLIM